MVYIDDAKGIPTRFRWVKVLTDEKFNRLAHTLARRIGRILEWQELLERDTENSYLAEEVMETGPMDQLLILPARRRSHHRYALRLSDGEIHSEVTALFKDVFQNNRSYVVL